MGPGVQSAWGLAMPHAEAKILCRFLNGFSVYMLHATPCMAAASCIMQRAMLLHCDSMCMQLHGKRSLHDPWAAVCFDPEGV